MSLIPPVRFTTVEEGLYRSAQPIAANLPFLETLELRLIISLVPCPDGSSFSGSPDDDENTPCQDPLPSWCKYHGIELVRVDVPHLEGQISLSHADATKIIHMIIDACATFPSIDATISSIGAAIHANGTFESSFSAAPVPIPTMVKASDPRVFTSTNLNVNTISTQDVVTQPAGGVLVHCLDGTTATGLLIMALRKIQLLDTAYAFAEYSRLSLGKETEDIDGEGPEYNAWLDDYRGEIVVPSLGLPKWLWGGKPLSSKHPTVQVKYRSSIPKNQGQLDTLTSGDSKGDLSSFNIQEQVSGKHTSWHHRHRRLQKESNHLQERGHSTTQISSISWLNLEI
eukprot:UC4_evm1s592